MELRPNCICMLCKQNTSVLSPEISGLYLTFIESTILNGNEYNLGKLQDKTTAKCLCVPCTHKLILARGFKEAYENTVKKDTLLKNTHAFCFLCTSKSNLVLTNDNDFSSKIKLFMDSVHLKPYIGNAVCFSCVFNLNICLEIYLGCLKLMKETPTKFNGQPLPDTPNKIVEDKTEAIAILEKENFTSTPQADSSTKTKFQKSRRLSATKTNRRAVWHSLQTVLKNKLKLKSVEQISKRSKWATSVSNDKKMFRDIPYVRIIHSPNSKQFNMVKNSRKRQVLNQNMTFHKLPFIKLRLSSNCILNSTRSTKTKVEVSK